MTTSTGYSGGQKTSPERDTSILIAGPHVPFLHSWGRFEYFAGIFTGPNDGFIRIPFFNSNINDTKDIEVVKPPAYDKLSGKNRAILKVIYHDDIVVEKDYIIDSYRRGMISCIPTVWGLSPAIIRQPLNPYDPEILFNHEQEFADYNLDARMEGDILTIKDPFGDGRRIVGKKILLEPEMVNGKSVFLGRYTEIQAGSVRYPRDRWEAILITETVRLDGRILHKDRRDIQGPVFYHGHYI